MQGNQDSGRKEIRVFVSSTFMDLNDERDYIIRRTFPRLAEYCRKRGIKFTGVDLRWGITEEQSKDGRTIRLCLDEIRKCQPFFINIIGQRYGWIPARDIEKDEEWRRDTEVSLNSRWKRQLVLPKWKSLKVFSANPQIK